MTILIYHEVGHIFHARLFFVPLVSLCFEIVKMVLFLCKNYDVEKQYFK